MPGTFLWNFIKIRSVVSEKMFKEKVNAQTDGRTMDNRPWHKLAGLWPVELKITADTWLFTISRQKIVYTLPIENICRQHIVTEGHSFKHGCFPI